MSKITNDDLTRSGTGCFIAVPMHMATVGDKGLTRERHSHSRSLRRLTSTVEIGLHGDNYLHDRLRDVYRYRLTQTRAQRISSDCSVACDMTGSRVWSEDAD